MYSQRTLNENIANEGIIWHFGEQTDEIRRNRGIISLV